MKLPRYPKYKDSGVEGLGEVPEHWEIKPLKYIASLKGRLGWQGLRSEEYTEEGPFLVTSEHFSNDRIDWQRCYHVSLDRYELAPEIQLRDDDLLMMKDGAAMGKLAFIDDLPGPACLNSHLLLFRPLNGRFENRFLYYILGGQSFNGYMVQKRTGTTFFGISQESIGCFSFAIPPASEQSSILRFLRIETSKIDALVEEQRRLIELLKEKRQAVISHAVTKGLNPDTPMKDSGIEWLGQIPAHWKVKRLKHISPFITVGIVVNPSSFVADEGLPYIYGGDIREGVIDCENSRRIDAKSSQDNSKTVLRAGDLLTVRVGAPGITAVVPPECEGGNCASVMLIRQGAFNSEWLCFAMSTRIVRFQVEIVQYGAAQEQFNISHAVNFWAPVPPSSPPPSRVRLTCAGCRERRLHEV